LARDLPGSRLGSLQRSPRPPSWFEVDPTSKGKGKRWEIEEGRGEGTVHLMQIPGSAAAYMYRQTQSSQQFGRLRQGDVYTHGSHVSWKVLEDNGIVSVKFPGPGKSWKMSLALRSPGNLFVKFSGLGKSRKMSFVV